MTTNIAVHPVERVLSALETLLEENPELEQAVNFYEELLPALDQARPVLHGLAVDRSAAQAKLKEGVPLLWGEWSSTNLDSSLELFMTLCRLATEGDQPDGEILMRSLLAGQLNLKALLEMALIQDRAALAELARSLGVGLNLMEAASRLLLTPLARAYSAAFSAAFDFAEWRQGYCPVCGAWPILGELRGHERLRYLRCGRCGSGWKFSRLHCFWCDNTQQRELSFLFDPDWPQWRVDVCHYCTTYLKTITTFDPIDPEMLLVHDLETLFLDQLAAREGYKRLHKQPLRQGA